MNQKRKALILSILGILGLIIITVGVTYAFFHYAKEGTTENSITSGTITFLYTEVSEVGRGISIQDAYPMSDEIGKVQVGEGKVFGFKITSNTSSSTSIPYEVTARKKNTSTLAEEAVRLYLTEVDGNLEEEVLLENYSNLVQTTKVDRNKYIEKTIYEGTVPANSVNYEKNFRLRMWIDESTDFSAVKGENGEDIYPYNGKEFTLTVNVYANGKVVTEEASVYKENLLNGADPVLSNNLIPVTIDDDGTVRKADTSKEWYSYEKKNWANAVVLKDDSTNYSNNEEIPEDNIESYFVWIPKYSYQLWDLEDYSNSTSIDSSKPHAIPIRFGLINTSDSVTGECTTPKVAGESGNCKVGDYMTHPAFQAFDSNGLWVGKFETGYDGATSKGDAQVNSSDSSKIVVKPNVYSWRGITVGNAFEAGYNYSRENESHMMKNTEWGALAYLTNSNYGRCQNGSCNEVRINNNSSFITGYASIKDTESGYKTEETSLGVEGENTRPYNIDTGYLASTTENITGVYDTAGGTAEYVMGYTIETSTSWDKSGIISIYPDFFTNPNWNKYYDKYTSSVNTDYNNRILGDATGEMGPFKSTLSSWYQDVIQLAEFYSPWFVRGNGCYGGSNAGIFYSYAFTGDKTGFSFRVVLAP